MSLLQPAKEQIIQAFKTEDDGPVIFHNWLKFKPDGGAESFQTYMDKFKELMDPKGVKAMVNIGEYRGRTKLCCCNTVIFPLKTVVFVA